MPKIKKVKEVAVTYLYYLPPNTIDTRDPNLDLDQDHALLEARHYMATQRLKSFIDGPRPDDDANEDEMAAYHDNLSRVRQDLRDAEDGLREYREDKGEAHFRKVPQIDPDSHFDPEVQDSQPTVEVPKADPIPMPDVPTSPLLTV